MRRRGKKSRRESKRERESKRDRERHKESETDRHTDSKRAKRLSTVSYIFGLINPQLSPSPVKIFMQTVQ